MTPERPTAVLLIAHGSRHARANDDLHELAARLEARGEHPIVEAAFLELAEPDIGEGAGRCVARGAGRVLMVPYFLSAGVHLLRDLTAARDDLRRRHPRVAFLLAPPLGPDPLLDRLVVDRIRGLDANGPEFDAPDVPAGCAASLGGRREPGPTPTGRAGGSGSGSSAMIRLDVPPAGGYRAASSTIPTDGDTARHEASRSDRPHEPPE